MEEDINLVTLGAVFSAMQKGECWEQSIEMLDRLPQKTEAEAGVFSASHLWRAEKLQQIEWNSNWKIDHLLN